MNRDKVISALKGIVARADEALRELDNKEPHKEARRKASPIRANVEVDLREISFNTNVLAFMSKYSRGLKGPQKFTLLLARLAKGKATQQVSKAELENTWNKMKLVLGGRFNPAHANRAKAKGWVDSPKHGIYTLSDSWNECLSKK